MSHLSTPDDGADSGERTERHWATAAVIILALLVVVATSAALYHGAIPQSRVETADPRTLHLGGEFIESNLGSALEPDGSVTVRFIGQQYSFTPSCIVVPTNTPVTFRATSADVVHGFLIDGTNINLMLVPGYVSSLGDRFDDSRARFQASRCQQFLEDLGFRGVHRVGVDVVAVCLGVVHYLFATAMTEVVLVLHAHDGDDPLRRLDLGGGLGVAYRGGERAPEIAEFARAMEEKLRFAIREGGKTVGAGVVASIVE